MKVLLIKDVYKLGRAGEVKKVAAGYGRNYLIPQGYAITATPGAMNQADRIMVKATERRAVLNEELSSVAEVLSGKALKFAVKAGETGRLYGSVSNEDLITAIQENFEIELERRQVVTEPIRQLGTYTVPIHLTMDLIPEITVIVHREGEAAVEEIEVIAEREELVVSESEPMDIEPESVVENINEVEVDVVEFDEDVETEAEADEDAETKA